MEPGMPYTFHTSIFKPMNQPDCKYFNAEVHAQLDVMAKEKCLDKSEREINSN